MNREFIVTGITRVLYIGQEDYKEPLLKFGPERQHSELIYYLRGSSLVRFNGESFLREQNSIHFLPKGQNNEYTVQTLEKAECIVIYFDTDCPVSARSFLQKFQNKVAVEALFKKLFSVWVAKNEGYYFDCVALLYKIFAEMQRETYLPEKQYNLIKPAVDYIGENLLKEKTAVSALAQRCGISESYLKKLFVRNFGVPPVQYMIRLKLNYACDLLRSTLYTVSQTAELCGYANVYFFSRQFKEYMGVTPTEFIKKYKTSL